MAEPNPGLFDRLCGDITPPVRRNLWRYLLALFAWAAVFVAASFVVRNGWLPDGPLVWIAVILPSVAALFAVAAYTRYLREADEMIRAIELHTLAVTLSAGFVVWPLGRMLERLGVPYLDGDATVLVMIAAYVIASFTSRLRYR